MEASRPLILVSNDDGIDAVGIRTLAGSLEAVGDVWVVAPEQEQSATSHSISLHQPLRVRQRSPQRFAVSGTPTDSIYLAVHQLLPRPPQVVVSGFNHGPNLGNDVMYSGTVSAAMEGALIGIPAVAFSQAIPDGKQGHEMTEADFALAATFAPRLVLALLERRLPPGVLLNVNVPWVQLDLAAPLPVKVTRLGFSDWEDWVTVRDDPRGRPYYWIGGDRKGHDAIVDSDNNGLAQGFITMTPIHYDLTDYRSFEYTRSLLQQDVSLQPDDLTSSPGEHPTIRRRGGR